MFTLRLEETKKHGDPKMSFKSYVESINQGQEKSRKKSATQCLEAPRTLGEIISHFSALIYKNHSDHSFAKSMTATLSLIIQSNRIHFQATDMDHFLNSLLLAL